MKVAFYAIGCKLNQFETEFMREQFEKAGWKIVNFREKADVYIINTCTVTAQADAKARQSIRQALKRNPNALVVATGCMTQLFPEQALEAGAHVVTGNEEKLHMPSIVEEALKGGIPLVRISPFSRSFNPMPIEGFHNHSRAFVKIQEGCNRSCSYCIVWRARGPARCADEDFVVNEVKRLVDAGFEEVVLTGTHLGLYRGKRSNLVGLLEELLKIEGLKKIRLSSLEPTEISDELIYLMASTDKIAKHLHIPLQSGSDRILKLMKRPYTARFFEDLIMKIWEKIPTVGIGLDVIVGFPTETEEDFEATYRLIERLPIYYMHIFSFSPRPQTPAADMRPQVRPDIKRKRWERLNELKQKKKRVFVEGLLGKEVDAVVEGRKSREGYSMAVSENYITLLVKEDITHLKRKVLKFKLLKRIEDKALASVAQKPSHVVYQA